METFFSRRLLIHVIQTAVHTEEGAVYSVELWANSWKSWKNIATLLPLPLNHAAVHGSPEVKKCANFSILSHSGVTHQEAWGVLKSVTLTSLFRCYGQPWEWDRKPPWTTAAVQNRKQPHEILPSKLICMRAFLSVTTRMQLKSATNNALHKHIQYIFFMFNLYKMVFKLKLHELYLTKRTLIMTRTRNNDGPCPVSVIISSSKASPFV